MKKPSRRTIAAFFINPIPREVRAPLLRDSAFCREIGYRPQSSYELSPSLSVEADSFVDAVRRAANGKRSAVIKFSDGKRQTIKLQRQPNGSASLTFEAQKQRFNIEEADLVSSKKSVRLKALKRLIDRRPLARDERLRWERISAKRTLEREEFVDLISSVNLTPEGLWADLQKPQSLSLDGLVPTEPRYYERLLAPFDGSPRLTEFASGSLNDTREVLIEMYGAVGLRRIAYSAWHQQLVPFDVLQTAGEEELNSLLKCRDPIGLLFGFELTCRAVIRNPQMASVGEEFLSLLFADKAKTQALLTILSAVAVATTVRLRLVYEEGSVPLAWFRLAALTHASVITDALGRPEQPEEFFAWVVNQVGSEFLWHMVVDRQQAPRWEPDWISSEQLYSELLGRAWNAVGQIPEEHRPKEWLDLIRNEIEQINPTRSISPFFAGPMDDFFKETAVGASRSSEITEIENRILAAETIDETAGFSGLVYLGHPSPDLAAPMVRILENSRTILARATEEGLSFLHACGRLAGIVRSIVLSNAVIDECIRVARTGNATPKCLLDLFRISLNACAAEENPKLYRSLVGETATRFSYVISEKRESAAHLISILDALSRRDPKLSSSLGRARAIVDAATLHS